MRNNKFNFIFIHGWGLNKSIWDNLINLLTKKNFCSSTFCIDLNFFSEDEEKKLELNFIKNQIVVTHSYGFHWFLKNQIKCIGLINFFGSPDYINYQILSKRKKLMLTKMIKNFKQNPEEVLKQFYKRCGINFNFKSLNFDNLLSALENMYIDKLDDELFNINHQIESYYSLNDPIFTPSINKIGKLKMFNHTIKFLKDKDHLLPMKQPKKALGFIEKFIKNKICL